MFAKKDAIVAKSNLKTSYIGASTIRYDSAFFDAPTEDVFSKQYWQEKKAITGHAQGRGTTWFFNHKNAELVLRHYYRGGMIAKFIRDHYFYTGLSRCRAYREFELLAQLKALNLPVPQPIAIRVKKVSLCFCVSDIITRKISQANDLVSLLIKRPLQAEELWNIGTTLRHFHNHNVYHHDLNAHNILLCGNMQASLIDFDQGEIRTEDESWKQDNLERLLRSLTKEQARLPNFHWRKESWQHLINGYSRP